MIWSKTRFFENFREMIILINLVSYLRLCLKFLILRLGLFMNLVLKYKSVLNNEGQSIGMRCVTIHGLKNL